MTPDTTIPTSIFTILVAAVVALAGTVAFLFKYYSARQTKLEEDRAKDREDRAREREAWAKEREAWAIERVQLRVEFEVKHREIVKQYADGLQAAIAEAREHEDRVRREFTENMEIVSSKAEESMEKIGGVMQRFYDRFVGPRHGSHY